MYSSYFGKSSVPNNPSEVTIQSEGESIRTDEVSGAQTELNNQENGNQIFACPECKGLFDSYCIVKFDKESKSLIYYCSNNHKKEIIKKDIVKFYEDINKKFAKVVCSNCEGNEGKFYFGPKDKKYLCENCYKSKDDGNYYMELKEVNKKCKNKDHERYTHFCKECFENRCDEDEDEHQDKMINLNKIKIKKGEIDDYLEKLKEEEDKLYKEEEKLRKTLDNIFNQFEEHKKSSLALINLKKYIVNSYVQAKENYFNIENAKEVIGNNNFQYELDYSEVLKEINQIKDENTTD